MASDLPDIVKPHPPLATRAPHQGRPGGGRRRRRAEDRPGADGPHGAAEHGHDAAARLRAERGADHLLHRSGRPHRRPDVQRAAPAQQRRSSGCGPARSGRRGRRGAARAATSSGATSPTTGSCAGSRTTASVSVFRMPSNNSNGNTFDFQGRQLSCEHLTRRVVRYEHDGSITVIADAFEGKRLNSPNDVVPHPDGSYWFTDPPYGGQLYEGAPDAAGGPSNQAGRLKNRLGQPPEIGDARSASCRPTATASIRAGRVDLVVSEDQVPDPNGLCFSPDYKKLYVVSTGQGPGRHRPGRQGRHARVRRRERQQAVQPEAVQRLHGRRREVRAGRRALRRRRQRLGARAMPAARSATAA